MLKSGLIIGAVMLVIGGGIALLLPACIPCLALLAGVGGGYLAGMFDTPAENGGAVRVGAGAGAIGGVGALLAHMVGGLVAAFTVSPEQAAEMMRQFGVEVETTNATAYYAGAIGGACCFGLFEIAFMAGLGALGGILWYQIVGKNNTPSMPAAPGALG